MKAYFLIFSTLLVLLFSVDQSVGESESTSDLPSGSSSPTTELLTTSPTTEQSTSTVIPSTSQSPSLDSSSPTQSNSIQSSTTELATSSPITSQSTNPVSSSTSQLPSTSSPTSSQSTTTVQPEFQVTIDCTITPVAYVYFGRLTSCRVDTNPDITNPESTVVRVRSTSGGAISNARVFNALSKTIRYIPKQLSTYLTDLTGIRLENTQLQSVTSCDLANFPKLTMFASVHNNVEFLEKNLFKNNPNIEFVSFQFNKLSYIEPTVFNPIKSNLHHLYLYSQNVPCLLGNAITKAGVTRMLTNLPKSKCADSANEPLSYILWTQGGSVCY